MSNLKDRGRGPRNPVPVLDAPGNAFPFANIPELFPELVALPAATLRHLLDLDPDALEAAVEIAILILDARQGDTDLEDNQDREDDRDSDNAIDWRASPYGEIFVDDGEREEDDPAEEDDPREPFAPYLWAEKIDPLDVAAVACLRWRDDALDGLMEDSDEDVGPSGS